MPQVHRPRGRGRGRGRPRRDDNPGDQGHDNPPRQDNNQGDQGCDNPPPGRRPPVPLQFSVDNSPYIHSAIVICPDWTETDPVPHCVRAETHAYILDTRDCEFGRLQDKIRSFALSHGHDVGFLAMWLPSIRRRPNIHQPVLLLWTSRPCGNIDRRKDVVRELDLPRGAHQLKDCLDLQVVPVRVISRTTRGHLANKVLMHFFGALGRLPPEDIILRSDPGAVFFSEKGLEVALHRNRAVLDPAINLDTMAMAGRIPMSQLTIYKNARASALASSKADDFVDRPWMTGEKILTFSRRLSNGKRDKSIQPVSYKVNMLGDMELTPDGREKKKPMEDPKKKNYYFYGDSNWGKSYAVDKAFPVTDARVVKPGDPRNLYDDLAGAQVVIFEEFEKDSDKDAAFGKSRAISLGDIKALTGGDSSSGALNRKGYGRSYFADPRCQVIIISNHSPYATFAGRRGKISRENARALEMRFNLCPIGIDALEDKVKHMHTSEITQAEYLHYLRNTFYDSFDLPLKFGPITNMDLRVALNKCMKVLKARYTTNGEEPHPNMSYLEHEMKEALASDADAHDLKLVLAEIRKCPSDVYDKLTVGREFGDREIKLVGKRSAFRPDIWEPFREAGGNPTSSFAPTVPTPASFYEEEARQEAAQGPPLPVPTTTTTTTTTFVPDTQSVDLYSPVSPDLFDDSAEQRLVIEESPVVDTGSDVTIVPETPPYISPIHSVASQSFKRKSDDLSS